MPLLYEMTEADFEAVLAWLPKLERREVTFLAPDSGGNGQSAPHPYSSEIRAFVDTLFNHGCVVPADVQGTRDVAVSCWHEPARLARLDLDDVRKVLTAHLRLDRFAPGHLARLYEDGHLCLLLRRLAECRAVAQGAGAA